MQRIALLESERHVERSGGGSAASVALHVVLLALAIAATAHSGTGVNRDSPVYFPLPRWRPQVQMVSQPVTRRAPDVTPHVPAISVAVPTVIPTSIPVPEISFVVPTATGTPTAIVPGSSTGPDSAATSIRGDTPLTGD